MNWTITNDSFNISPLTLPNEITDLEIIQTFCNGTDSQIFISIFFLTFLLIIKILFSKILHEKINNFFNSMYDFSSTIILFYITGIGLTKINIVSEIFIKRLIILIISLIIVLILYIFLKYRKSLDNFIDNIEKEK